ncbi:MAG: peptidylprolyl isomerase [Pseudomonas sp.]|jgi:peptidyl-prolyl cis-trans isomerase A (cyclophilin A)|nr:peptidylprolyl isomerase [Pseudomonas sp.]MDD2222446.1 peptidylprolyl isomerase [Pseudomonas sp.]MDY0415880.1 peptidylprolyl isomerase [Pseudomonas sp.]NLO54961.1 peptidylprolyl isomerase A [Gammaproteobacteria bacterium]
MLKKLLLTGCMVFMAANVLAADNPHVVLNTSFGEIELELEAEKAPITVTNFLDYVDAERYNGTIFHRVIPNFMIQGGGFDSYMQQKATKPAIKNEADNGLKNARGTVAMARTQAPDSATMQFFINHADNDFLNHSSRDFGYAVFAKVVRGMDVVDQIAQVKTTLYGRSENVPIDPIVIKTIKRID